MLKDQVSIVTGAARGIGKEIAQGLAKAGAVVIVLDKLEEESQCTVREIESQGGKAVAMKVDATDGQLVKNAVEEIIRQWGRIDILINNIGWNKPTPFLESEEELWHQLLDINLMVPLRFCRWVLPYMVKQQYGVVVNIASLAGLCPQPGSIGYNAAKAGVVAITRSLAAATAQYNIRINCICPGMTETELLGELRRSNPKYAEDVLKMVPMRRTCQPQEIAKVALFLVSEDSSYMTGQRLSVDGGAFMLQEAYLKILHAREFVSQWNRKSNVQARQLAEEAISLDLQYAGAYATLAVANMMDVWLQISKSPKGSLMKAIELAEKATSLDDSYASAHALLGFLYVQIGEHEKGIAAGERAIERAPNSADAHSWLAQVLNYSGRAKEAIALNEKAFRLNPHHHSVMYYGHAAVSYMLIGRYEDAVKMFNEMLSRWPNNVPGHALLVHIYAEWGRDEEARAAAQNLLRIDPKFSVERRARSLPFKDPALQAHYLELMRKAGLK